MAKLKKILINGFLVVFGLFCSLLLMEFFLQIWNPFETRVQANKIILPAHRQYKVTIPGTEGAKDQLVVHTKNNLGFRGPNWPERPEDFQKWFFVGGSTTEEFYLSDGETWSEKVGQALSSAIPNLWVNNAGLDGHSSFGHTVLLKDFLVDLKPEVIFYLVGINDIGNDIAVRYDQRLKPDWYETPGLGDVSNWIKAKTELGRLADMISRKAKAKRYSRNYGKIDVSGLAILPEGEANPRPAFSKTLAQHKTQFLPGFRQRLEELAENTKQAGALPVFITQPILFGPHAMSGEAIDLSAVLFNGQTGKEHHRLMELYNAVTRDVAAIHKSPLIDLAKEMPHDPILYSDMMHYTPAGDDKVAAIVTRFIESHLELFRAPGAGS